MTPTKGTEMRKKMFGAFMFGFAVWYIYQVVTCKVKFRQLKASAVPYLKS